MKFAVINGGYEEYMRKLAEDCDREYAEFIAEFGPPPCRKKGKGFLAYFFALSDQRRERARRRYERSCRGNCVVLVPAVFRGV
jgi:hypothetical protein